jgi:hypothetical protein
MCDTDSIKKPTSHPIRCKKNAKFFTEFRSTNDEDTSSDTTLDQVNLKS